MGWDMFVVEAALEVSGLPQGAEVSQSCCVEGNTGVLLWPVEAHPALGTWAQLTLSLLAVSLVSCLCPGAHSSSCVGTLT